VATTLRPLRATDEELSAADDLLNDAYETGSRLRELVLYRGAQPDGWFVIEEDGALLAIAGAAAFGAFSWVGFVGTHPSARGRGLATQISQHLVAWSGEHGCRTVALDASDEGRPVYERLGFAVTGWTVDLAIHPQLLPLSGPRAARASAADLQAILALDPSIFGGDRSTLLRHFDRDLAPACFVTHAGDGSLAGYVFARERLIGPGYARDAAQVGPLVRAALDIPGGRHLLVPAESRWLGALQDLGLAEARRLAHMRLGPQQLPGDRSSLFAQLSFATG
jgi:GNAT superfamily N-acetyltransferase